MLRKTRSLRVSCGSCLFSRVGTLAWERPLLSTRPVLASYPIAHIALILRPHQRSCGTRAPRGAHLCLDPFSCHLQLFDLHSRLSSGRRVGGGSSIQSPSHVSQPRNVGTPAGFSLSMYPRARTRMSKGMTEGSGAGNVLRSPSNPPATVYGCREIAPGRILTPYAVRGRRLVGVASCVLLRFAHASCRVPAGVRFVPMKIVLNLLLPAGSFAPLGVDTWVSVPSLVVL
ncbi:hypothetical protein C8R47DRAFT_186696 [Mycena vitilis]|nr:hypothetical protein C8R47DRAFT_186696 [Mycena vitilis]